ncbi:MAG: anti-sigma F factor [Clostridia bacterium]|nr:anti-sigma F factor [Clostridia bacterium]
MVNELKIKMPSLSANEAMARATVAAFCAQLDPSAVEVADVKCAVSEAVTNCIVHGYKDTIGMIYINIRLYEERVVRIEIKDRGCGIEDVNAARQPLFTTDAANERSGMGFTVMESFCDALKVRSKRGVGTSVTLIKIFEGR